MNLRDQLIAEEGRNNIAYLDTLGYPTIGVGHKGSDVRLGMVWTDAQIDAAFDADIAAKTAEVKAALPWFGSLNEPRQAALLQMAFQMGTRGLLGFPNTLAAIHDGRWADAGTGMLASKWAQQTPYRVARLARQMTSGMWII